MESFEIEKRGEEREREGKERLRTEHQPIGRKVAQ